MPRAACRTTFAWKKSPPARTTLPASFARRRGSRAHSALVQPQPTPPLALDSRPSTAAWWGIWMAAATTPCLWNSGVSEKWDDVVCFGCASL